MDARNYLCESPEPQRDKYAHAYQQWSEHHTNGTKCNIHGPMRFYYDSVVAMGWMPTSSTQIRADHGDTFNLLTVAVNELESRLITAWEQQMCKEVKRKDMPDLPTIDRHITTKIYDYCTPQERGLMETVHWGALLLAEDKARRHDLSIGMCKHCQQPDTPEHRWFTCTHPPYVQARRAHQHIVQQYDRLHPMLRRWGLVPRLQVHTQKRSDLHQMDLLPPAAYELEERQLRHTPTSRR